MVALWIQKKEIKRHSPGLVFKVYSIQPGPWSLF